MPHVILSPSHLGKLLKHFRTNRGLSQQAVAKRLWVNYKTIGRRELGDHQMLIGDVLHSAALFDYDLVLQKRRRPGARPTGTGWPA